MTGETRCRSAKRIALRQLVWAGEAGAARQVIHTTKAAPGDLMDVVAATGRIPREAAHSFCPDSFSPDIA
ncbi:hypothetical protein NDU88_003781 [Pleurodeles waltl]|uniref:Uncharacterized protein n=1 Tax=Pleurodeles waltl TaxID=8319 RepID=A0AAV7SGX5_PLEWA|nr:hypothetical protein NDU88_003781 [Pleurodeles waltl]